MAPSAFSAPVMLRLLFFLRVSSLSVRRGFLEPTTHITDQIIQRKRWNSLKGFLASDCYLTQIVISKYQPQRRKSQYRITRCQILPRDCKWDTVTQCHTVGHSRTSGTQWRWWDDPANLSPIVGQMVPSPSPNPQPYSKTKTKALKRQRYKHWQWQRHA